MRLFGKSIIGIIRCLTKMGITKILPQKPEFPAKILPEMSDSQKRH